MSFNGFNFMNELGNFLGKFFSGEYIDNMIEYEAVVGLG